MRGATRSGWFAVTIGVLCGAAGSAAADGQLKLTIVSAKLDAKKMAATGHMSTASLSDLDCLALPGLRATADRCGGAQAAADDATGKNELDPVIRIELGDRVIRTYPVPDSATPRYDYASIIDRSLLEGGNFALFQVIDYKGVHDENVLAKKLVPGKSLLAPGTRTVAIGAATVTYRIETVASEATRTYHYRVAGDQQMADLAKNAKISDKSSDGNYVAIPIAEGETIAVAATGQVRPSAKKHPNITAGPDGIPTITTKIQYNQPGFRAPGNNHAALIGQLGPDSFMVGAHKTINAKTSGLFLLGVNDLKVSDNDGGFDVTVTVTTPLGDGGGGGVKKGGAGDVGPSGLDARVVEQVVDSHNADLEKCVEGVANPNGSLVLAFSISADGSPLGVIVQDASPNLKAAGDCMRKKALAWHFPPPHGVVTARYPLSFSQS